MHTYLQECSLLALSGTYTIVAQFPYASAGGTYILHIRTSTLLVVYFSFTPLANRQFSPLILDETSPDPLGLWRFTWEVPNRTSFVKFHHCHREERYFSISGHKPVKMASSPDD